jgi:hypothetical protein
MNVRLRKALDNEPVPRDLEARVRARLDKPGFSGWGRLISSLSMLLILGGGLQFTAMRKVHDLLQAGVNDHVHCAIAGEYPHQTERAAMVRDLGPYSLMLQPVIDKMPGDDLVSAHRCTIQGRDYVHIILRRHGTLISVILTRKGKNDVYPRAVAAHKSGSIDGYSVAGFEAGSYLGYVVSALPESTNNGMAEKIAPVIKRYTGA